MKILIVLLIFIGGHRCKYKLCPYKGIKKHEWSQKVKEYTECEPGEDCHAVDMLHLLRPRWNYDKIHEALFTD